MPYYRLYTIGANGCFKDVATIDLRTDAEACEIAAVRLDGHPAIEVWQEARRVALVTRDGLQMAEPAG
jgi:hypothetical protein